MSLAAEVAERATHLVAPWRSSSGIREALMLLDEAVATARGRPGRGPSAATRSRRVESGRGSSEAASGRQRCGDDPVTRVGTLQTGSEISISPKSGLRTKLADTAGRDGFFARTACSRRPAWTYLTCRAGPESSCSSCAVPLSTRRAPRWSRAAEGEWSRRRWGRAGGARSKARVGRCGGARRGRRGCSRLVRACPRRAEGCGSRSGSVEVER